MIFANVTDADWMSYSDAGQRLGLGVRRLNARVFFEHLEPVNSPAGVRGFSKVSVMDELNWQRQANVGRRLGRAARCGFAVVAGRTSRFGNRHEQIGPVPELDVCD